MDIVPGVTAIPNDIMRLAADDPIVRGWFDDWRAGNCSWEECLVGMVCGLGKRNVELTEQLLELKRNETRPYVLVEVDRKDA